MDQELIRTYVENLLSKKKWMTITNQINKDAIREGIFPNATFELTAFCTLKCPMCYVRIDKERAETLGARPLTASQWIELAKQFRDQGGLFLLVTGGEPMMRPDFPEIYDEISKIGLYVTLFTNGTTVDDRMLAILKKRPPTMVGITLYGSSEETYRKFGGSEGSFQRAINGLDRLLTIPNLALDVRFTACRDNYKDFESVYALVEKRNKFITLDYGSCAPVRGAFSDARKQRLTQEQKKEVSEIITDISMRVTDEYEKLQAEARFIEVEEQSENSKATADKNRMWCNGGKASVYIAWDGRMYPCDMTNFPYSFPLEQGFKEAALDIRKQVDCLLLPDRCLTCANMEINCFCIPRAQNEMLDCARMGEKCDYIPKP